MGFGAVLLAAVCGFVVGAIYYGVFSAPWKEASGVPLGEDGNPTNAKSPVPYVISFIGIILVAGMMRHTFATSGIDTLGKGIVTGLGIGAFFISPWIWLNNGYTVRPIKLSVIDSGYAILACAVMGAVLTLL